MEMGEIPDGAIPVGGMNDQGQAKFGEGGDKWLMSTWSEGPGLKCSEKECLGMSSPAMPGLAHASFKGISATLKRASKPQRLLLRGERRNPATHRL